jgi:hypothetical protein
VTSIKRRSRGEREPLRDPYTRTRADVIIEWVLFVVFLIVLIGFFSTRWT